MRTRKLGLAAVVTFLVAAASSVALASPAAAASDGGVQLSSNGVTYSSTYSGSLFSSATLMVPSTTQASSFWVKNASQQAGFLRVSLSDVTGADTDFGQALAMSATTPGWPGSMISVAAAQPCYVLTQGQVLPAGSTVKVDVALALGDLTGLVGQAENVGFDLRVALSGTQTGSIPATDCPVAGIALPGTPSGATNGGSTTTTRTFVGTGRSTFVGSSSGTSTWSSDDSVLYPDTETTTEPVEPTAPNDFSAVLAANTGLLHQEFFVWLWIAGAAIGSWLAFFVRRRRDRDDADSQPMYPMYPMILDRNGSVS